VCVCMFVCVCVCVCVSERERQCNMVFHGPTDTQASSAVCVCVCVCVCAQMLHDAFTCDIFHSYMTRLIHTGHNSYIRDMSQCSTIRSDVCHTRYV